MDAGEGKPTGPPELAPDRTIAALLLSIDHELAARLLQNFSEEAVARVTRAMRALEEQAVDREAVQRVYRTVLERLRRGDAGLADVGGAMRSMLVKAFGEDRGADFGRRAAGDLLARKPFAKFEALTAEDLAHLLTEEHPQIAAVFLAHLDRRKGGEVLRFLAADVRADLVHRVATLDRTPPDVVQRVLEVMSKKVEDMGLDTLRAAPKAWVRAAAQLLNHLGGGEKAVLDRIGAVDTAMATAIREEMFTFEDLARLDRRSMQKVLASVDSRQLAVALKATTPAAERNILANLSRRAAALVVEERDALGPTPLSAVVASQAEILHLIRELVDKGEVSIVAREQMV